MRKLVLIVIPAALSIGCSEVKFNSGQNLNNASAVQPLAEPAPAPPEQKTVTVAYPSYAKVLNTPLIGYQAEILINTQADSETCKIAVVVSTIEAGLCNDFPEYFFECKNDEQSIAPVSRSTDYTCAQAYHAKELKESRGESCPEVTQSLTADEIAEINDPKIYKVSGGNADNEAIADSTAVLPSLNSITLDANCGCNYKSSNMESFSYTYPALQQHCQAHFGDVYQ